MSIHTTIDQTVQYRTTQQPARELAFVVLDFDVTQEADFLALERSLLVSADNHWLHHLHKFLRFLLTLLHALQPRFYTLLSNNRTNVDIIPAAHLLDLLYSTASVRSGLLFQQLFCCYFRLQFVWRVPVASLALMCFLQLEILQQLNKLVLRPLHQRRIFMSMTKDLASLVSLALFLFDIFNSCFGRDSIRCKPWASFRNDGLCHFLLYLLLRRVKLTFKLIALVAITFETTVRLYEEMLSSVFLLVVSPL